MIADVNVFRLFSSYRITGNEYQALVIPTDLYGWQIVIELPQKDMHPDHLVAAVTEHHVFGFHGWEGDGTLGSWSPGDHSSSQFQEVSWLGSLVKGIWGLIWVSTGD